MFKEVKPANLLFVCLFVFFQWNSQPEMKMQSLCPHPHCDGRLGGMLLCWMLLFYCEAQTSGRGGISKRQYGRQQAHQYVLGSLE